MNLRDIFIGGIVVAAIIILGRIIIGSPFITRIAESFVSGSTPTPTNIITLCPQDSIMYMYDGRAYCCNGTVNANAHSAKQSCIPISGRDAKSIFCSLGPSSSEATNCLTLKASLMKAEAATFCPSAKPTFVQDNNSPARCCDPPGGNSDYTACVAGSCTVASSKDPFKVLGSCQYLKAKEMDGACPTGSKDMDVPQANGTTVYGCLKGSTICYNASTINRLKIHGHDTSGMNTC